ncbi:hypothetical protein FDI38_gp060 [Streptomyces phage Peebs]|uniref:Uncharacterized protein n=1 Tax=Streptomyces phage Peebs TaxID=2023994 RepID=A0A222Z283_9CAUD|nr:hypothetical protein FDI38_gp060 [Streptomyces phage Peebs]ASR77906.1 hypothetical protein SEA_PEEBS_247 [Streptomyces phage Peebs]
MRHTEHVDEHAVRHDDMALSQSVCMHNESVLHVPIEHVKYTHLVSLMEKLSTGLG